MSRRKDSSRRGAGTWKVWLEGPSPGGGLPQYFVHSREPMKVRPETELWEWPYWQPSDTGEVGEYLCVREVEHVFGKLPDIPPRGLLEINLKTGRMTLWEAVECDASDD